MKYAFIMNSRTLDPERYSVLYEDQGNQYFFTGVHGMNMTRENAKKLAAEGYQLIDLCGNYGEKKADDIAKEAGDTVKVNYAKYSAEDEEKFNNMPSSDRFGIIVLGFDLSSELVRLELESDEFNTYIAIVSREEFAAREAQKLVEEGIHFIELCGYFNAEKAAVVADAIESKVPVGYCGN